MKKLVFALVLSMMVSACMHGGHKGCSKCKDKMETCGHKGCENKDGEKKCEGGCQHGN